MVGRIKGDLVGEERQMQAIAGERGGKGGDQVKMLRIEEARKLVSSHCVMGKW